MPNLSSEPIGQISNSVTQYIYSQRDHFASQALRLTSVQQGEMSGIFRSDSLDSARILVIERQRIPGPSFYPMLRQLGFSNLPEFSSMAAVTFRFESAPKQLFSVEAEVTS